MNKSLKQYVDDYSYIVDDKTIIRQYIIDNNLESDFIKMISELATSQVEKLTTKRNHTNFIVSSTMMTMEYLLKTYSKEVALFLLDLELCYAQTFDFSPKLLEKAKEIIPTIDRPKSYFNDIVVHLNLKYGIRFKNHRDGYDNQYFSRNKNLD